MPIAAVAAVVAAGAAAGSAAAKQDAERKAINKQKDAVKSLQAIDVEASKKTVADQDLKYYKDSLAGFKELHPDLDSARQKAEGYLAETFREDPLAEASRLQKQRVAEAEVSPDAAGLRQELLAKTRENLALGTSLSPEYQGELVRAGLESAGTVGIGGNRQGAVTQKLGKLIGSAGLELEAQRRAEAAKVLTLDDMLTQSRQNILGNLLSSEAQLVGNKLAVYGQTAQTLNSGVPSVGLRGSDVLGLQLKNLEFENARKMKLGELDAQKALSKGAAISGYIQAGNQAFQGVAGAMGGGGGSGGFGGGGGGGGFNFGSLFSSFGGGGGSGMNSAAPSWANSTLFGPN